MYLNTILHKYTDSGYGVYTIYYKTTAGLDNNLSIEHLIFTLYGLHFIDSFCKFS